MDEAEIAGGRFIISCCEASRVFETVDAAFDAVSERVDAFVDDDFDLAVFSAGDDRFGAARLEILANVIGIISAIGEDDFRRGAVGVHHDVVAFVVRDFAAGDFRRDGETFRVSAEVDFGGEAAF